LDKTYILAIDLGTSGPKAAIVSLQGEVIDHVFEKTRTIILSDQGVEEDPDEWWSTIISASKKVLKKTGISGRQIEAVCCTAQWSGTVAVDEKGRHLMNAITWMDSRGKKYVRKITDGFVKIEGYGLLKIKKWISLTGGIPLRTGKDPIAHILFIKNEFPEIYEKTYKFLEPKDFLNLKFTGSFFASDESITLHWLTDNRDINNIRYNDNLIKMSGISKDKLPDLRQAVDVIGPVKKEVADELGLSPDTKVIMGTPDLHSAAIGSGAVKDFQGHLYIGTSSWLLCHVPFKKTDMFHNMGSLPSAVPGKYLLINEQDIAAESLNFLKDNIFFPDDELSLQKMPEDIYDVFNRMAKKIPAGSNGLIFTPWLNGERSPVDDSQVRGSFYNISLQTTRSHMIRAVFEGVAFNSNWLLKYVEKFIKKPLDRINIIGGGARSDLWCQIHADVMNRTIRRVKDPIQANLRGAALLASAGLGHITFDEISDNIEFDAVFKPDPENIKMYQELFKQFENIYKKNKTIYKKLNKDHK